MSLYQTLRLFIMYITVGARVLPYEAVPLKGPFCLFTSTHLSQSFLEKHFLFC